MDVIMSPTDLKQCPAPHDFQIGSRKSPGPLLHHAHRDLVIELLNQPARTNIFQVARPDEIRQLRQHVARMSAAICGSNPDFASLIRATLADFLSRDWMAYAIP
jgi:hypothetical protein